MTNPMRSSASPMPACRRTGSSSRLMTGTRSLDFILFPPDPHNHENAVRSTFLPFAEIFDDGRQDGDEDDREDDELEILPDDGDVAEEIARGHEQADPQGRAEDVVAREDRVRHRADAG